MQCPNCRSLLRGAALRCWKCGQDLTRPVEPPPASVATSAVAAGAPVTGAPGAAGVPALEPQFAPATEVGRAPHNWFVRTLDPRIDAVELERAARGYAELPWIECYRKLAGVALVPLALFLLVLGRVLSGLGVGMAITRGPSGEFVLPWWAYLPSLLPWGVLALLAVAYFVYRGSRAAMGFAALTWITALGLPLLARAADLARIPVVFGLALLVLYLELVPLWKAVCVEFAREDLLRRMRPIPGPGA